MSNVVCFEFDHQRDKTATIGTLVSQCAGETQLLDELAKCEVVCVNCHKLRTGRTGQHWRFRLHEQVSAAIAAGTHPPFEQWLNPSPPRETKWCNQCELMHPVDEFDTRGKSELLASYCRQGRRRYVNEMNRLKREGAWEGRQSRWLDDGRYYCAKCKAAKDPSAFRQKKNGSPDPPCIDCKNDYQRRRSQAEDGGVATLRQERLELKRRFVYAYLTKHACVDCPAESPWRADPLVLEFDHRDPSAKRNNINDLLNQNLGLKRLVQEMELCDVRCGNCHRRRTAAERGWYRAMLDTE